MLTKGPHLVWKQPNYPEDSRSASSKAYDLLEGVGSQPVSWKLGQRNLGNAHEMLMPCFLDYCVQHTHWQVQRRRVDEP